MKRFDPLRRTPLAIGLVAGGLLINPWLIGYLAADDGTIDNGRIVATLLFIGASLVLGGLQVKWRWVDRISWQAPVSAIRAATVVAVTAFVIAATHWQLVAYLTGHNHTHIMAAGHQQPTAEEEQWADDFYHRSLAAALKHGWFDYDKAMAQGFQVDRVNRTHFPNLQNMFDDAILDPERPEWLIYNDTPDGKILMGFMFFTRRLDEVGPTPAGPIAQWHYHPYETPRCAVNALWTVGRPDESGRCAEGVPVSRTPEMFHVWFIDHPLGRFTEMNVVPEYWRDRRFDRGLIHPITVHFAIALFMIAVLLDAIALVTRKEQFHRSAWVNLVLAAIAVVVAVGAGMSAEILLKPTHEAHQTLDVHKQFAFAGLATILLLTVWRYVLRGSFPRKGAILYVALSLAGVVAIGGAGLYGGEMVYTHGAGVRIVDRFARDRYWRQVRDVYRAEAEGTSPLPRPATLPASNSPASGGHSGHH